MAGLSDIESISQRIAQLHLNGKLILDPEPVGKHIRRVTVAQIMNASRARLNDEESDGPLTLGGRECKYVRLRSAVD